MVSLIEVRESEGDQPQPNLLWDMVWQPWRGQSDYALADPSELQNKGGLSARAALHTAVIIALFTDKRIATDHPLFKFVEDGDQRGWFGDGVDVRIDLFEDHMGSLLWVFERAYLNEEIRMLVEAETLEALQPLIRQGLCVRAEAQADASFAVNRLDLFVQLYGKDGKTIYNQRFEDIWGQVATAPKPKPFPDRP